MSSSRIANFLLKRLWREAARDAIDVAIADRWLMEEGQSDRAEVDEPRQVKIGNYYIEDDELRPERASGRRLSLGSKLHGRSRVEITRFLKREGIKLDPNARSVGEGDEEAPPMDGASLPGTNEAARVSVASISTPPTPVKTTAKKSGRQAKAPVSRDNDNGQADPRLIADVVRAIRVAAAPPPVDEIAMVLLLAEGIARSGLSEDQVLTVLSERQPVISVLCPVVGFETRFLIMLKNGGILPRPVATGFGHEMRGLHVSFVGTSEGATKVVVFAGRHFDSDEASRTEARVGQAAASGYPLLGVAETAERIPKALKLSASLDLECGPISSGLIARVLAEVLGPLPDELSLADLDADCRHLSLFDLPLAIRPGTSHLRAVEVLVRLAAARRKASEEDDKDESGKAGSGSSSAWRSSRDRSVKGSGSEIIRPVSQEMIACDPFVPTVDRLHGYGEARSWALNLGQDLELWRAKQLDWSAISAKLLLSGPPGTGKTSFAKALCNSLQVPLIATSVSTWLEASYLGDVVRRMKTAFEEASEHAPCILFIDEIDGIGRRGQGKDYDDYWNTIVNKALELLDGAVRSSGIVIVGATNHPDVIDPALLRSGRLETHIRIPPPDINALAGILRHHLGNDFSDVIAARPGGSASLNPDADVAQCVEAVTGSEAPAIAKPSASGHEALAASPDQNTDSAAPQRQREGARTC